MMCLPTSRTDIPPFVGTAMRRSNEYVFKARAVIDAFDANAAEAGDWPRFCKTFGHMHERQKPLSLQSMISQLHQLNVPCLAHLHAAAYGVKKNLNKKDYIEKFTRLGEHHDFGTECQKLFPSWDNTTSNVAKLTCPHLVCIAMKVSVRGKSALNALIHMFLSLSLSYRGEFLRCQRAGWELKLHASSYNR